MMKKRFGDFKKTAIFAAGHFGNFDCILIFLYILVPDDGQSSHASRDLDTASPTVTVPLIPCDQASNDKTEGALQASGMCRLPAN